MTDRRLIEDSLPLETIGNNGAREKSLRKGNPSTMHIWWARRPLSACRAAVYAALCEAPRNQDEREQMHDDLIALSDWYSHLPGADRYKQVHALRQKNADKVPRPKVLDPFSGGGAIPLAASELGCETYALDINPVAHMVELATLYFAQKLGSIDIDCSELSKATPQASLLDKSDSTLINELSRWGNIIEERVKNDVEDLYPSGSEQGSIVAYIWSKTVSCSNPACGAEIPLLRQLWLEKKKTGESTALKISADKTTKQVTFTIETAEEFNFNPQNGTVSRGNALCPVCNQTTDASSLRAAGKGGHIGERLICVVATSPNTTGKVFRLPEQSDIDGLLVAEKVWEGLQGEKDENGLSEIPDEPLPPTGTLGFRIRNYGYETWGDLFNNRQLVTLIRLGQHIRDSHTEREEQYSAIEGLDSDFAKAITTYLGLMHARLSNYSSRQCTWLGVDGTRTKPAFTIQGMPMVWDYAESYPFNDASANWMKSKGSVIEALRILNKNNPCNVVRGSADRLPFEDRFFDAIVTDPPYYDAVPYSDLSDFFYVWHRRVLGSLYPDLYLTELTPKRSEIVENPAHNKDSSHFEDGMLRTFGEVQRVLKDDGIVVVVFAHKSTDAWETLLNALLAQGLVVTASWPIETEKRGRLRAQGSAALASSVFIVCRKRISHNDGFFDDVLPELQARLHERLDYFWTQGIRGADFFMSAIGPAVEVFGQYKRVLKLSGEEVSVGDLLERVRAIVSDYALQRIVHGAGAGEVDEASRFYVIWRWAFGTSQVDSGEAIHMAQSMGCEFSELTSALGVLRQDKSKVVLRGPKERNKLKSLGLPNEQGIYSPLIDVLHKASSLWEAGERQELVDFLSEALPDSGEEKMQRLAQSIVDVLPPDDRERLLYENFLVGSKTLPKPTSQEPSTNNQQKLF